MFSGQAVRSAPTIPRVLPAASDLWPVISQRQGWCLSTVYCTTTTRGLQNAPPCHCDLPSQSTFDFCPSGTGRSLRRRRAAAHHGRNTKTQIWQMRAMWDKRVAAVYRENMQTWGISLLLLGLFFFFTKSKWFGGPIRLRQRLGKFYICLLCAERMKSVIT